jgi:hypothetical protein
MIGSQAPLRKGSDYLAKDDGTKKCRKCHSIFALNFYRTDNSRPDRLHPYCVPCRNLAQNNLRKHRMATSPEYVQKQRELDRKRAKTRNQRKRTKAEHKDYFLKWKYGFGLEAYEKMLLEQKGVCLICKKPETRKNKHTGTCRLHVDHCHETGTIRGLLCSKCNFGIGNFNDNIETMQEAVRYLMKWKAFN